MRARLTSPCLCGSIVRPGMEIAFDHVMRRVVMCPKCSPSRGRRKYRASMGVVVSYKADGFVRTGYRVQSLKDRETGKLSGFVVRFAAGDSDPKGWVKFVWHGGQFMRQLGFSMDTPSHITADDLPALIELAKEASQKAAA